MYNYVYICIAYILLFYFLYILRINTMSRKTSKKIAEVIKEDIEEPEDTEEPEENEPEPVIEKVKLTKKGKPYLTDEERREIRLNNLKKATDAKLRYKKEREQQEKHIMKQVIKNEKNKVIENEKPQKTSIVKKKKQVIIEESESDEEVEKIIIRRKKNKPVQYEEADYISLIKQNTKDTIQQKLENERLKMAMLSIMPSYKF